MGGRDIPCYVLVGKLLTAVLPEIGHSMPCPYPYCQHSGILPSFERNKA